MQFVIIMNKLISILIIITIFGCAPRQKDSYSSKAHGRKLELKFKDTFSSKLQGEIRLNTRKDSYSNAPRKKISYKWKDSFTGSSGRNNQIGFKDSYSSSGSGLKIHKINRRDSYSTSRRKKNKGYKDPNKKWWNIFGKKTRHGKKYKTRKSYSVPRKRKKIEKKKIKYKTGFEGL